MTEIITQECNECHKELPLYEFGYSPSRGRPFSKCKECTKNRRRDWYKKDPNISSSPWRKRKVIQPPEQ